MKIFICNKITSEFVQENKRKEKENGNKNRMLSYHYICIYIGLSCDMNMVDLILGFTTPFEQFLHKILIKYKTIK